jgi:hypothetical protein
MKVYPTHSHSQASESRAFHSPLSDQWKRPLRDFSLNGFAAARACSRHFAYAADCAGAIPPDPEPFDP